MEKVGSEGRFHVLIYVLTPRKFSGLNETSILFPQLFVFPRILPVLPELLQFVAEL